jgi:uncharacterized protein YsxB (DUF464 family)
MIKVKIYGSDRIVLSGHALFDDYGKDIVCAGVSSVVTTTINAILTFDKNYIYYQKENDKLTIEVKNHNNIVDNLINNMIDMLKDIEEDYPNNIKIGKEN